MQTNEINGFNLIDIAQGQFPKLSMVGLNAGGTPNHKLEAAIVQFGAFWLDDLKGNPYDSPALYWQEIHQKDLQLESLARLKDLLNQHATLGHQLIEACTDSHAPIYIRAATSMALIEKRLSEKSREKANISHAIDEWISHHLQMCSLGAIPSGPLSGRVILPCARKAPKMNSSNERDQFWCFASGLKRLKGGPNYWDLSKDRPDISGLPISRMVESIKPGYFKNLLKPEAISRFRQLKFISPLIVHRFKDGHLAEFPDGIPGGADISTRCWVKYSTGEVHFGQNPAPDLGGESKTINI